MGLYCYFWSNRITVSQVSSFKNYVYEQLLSLYEHEANMKEERDHV